MEENLMTSENHDVALHPAEARLFLRALRNLLRASSLDPALRSNLLDIIRRTAGIPGLWGKHYQNQLPADCGFGEVDLRDEGHVFERRLSKLAAQEPSEWQRTVDAVASLCGSFTSNEHAVLGMLVRLNCWHPFNELRNSLCLRWARGPEDEERFLFSRMLDLPEHEVARVLADSGDLVQSGLVVRDHDIGLLPSLVTAIHAGMSRHRELLSAVLGPALQAKLDAQDFGHLQNGIPVATNIISNALRHGALGAHILLYGPPGTGKTELAKVLAAEADAPLFAVPCSEKGSRSSDRLARLRLTAKLASAQDRAVILVDDADDVVSIGLARDYRCDRDDLHGFIETCPVPVIWTVNHLGSLGTAVIRRMAYAVEVGIPPTSARKRIYASLFASAGLNDLSTANDLATALAAPPALAATGSFARWRVHG
jgi:hypothetical protein